MTLRQFERRCAVGARMLTFLAVFASTVGAVLMIVIGLKETVFAVRDFAFGDHGELPAGDATAILLISALDRFLMAIVLLYFGYGIYVLFIRPDERTEELGIPAWLRVEGIGELKQTLAEVIIVVLFVLFLRVALETYISQETDITWEKAVKILTLPAAIFLLSASLKLAELHPKRKAGERPENDG